MPRAKKAASKRLPVNSETMSSTDIAQRIQELQAERDDLTVAIRCLEKLFLLQHPQYANRGSRSQ